MTMTISGYDADTIVGLVVAAGFEVLEAQVETQLERGKVDVPFLWILAQKQ